MIFRHENVSFRPSSFDLMIYLLPQQFPLLQKISISAKNVSQKHIPDNTYFRGQENAEIELSFTYLPAGSLQGRWRNFSQEHVRTEKRQMASNWKRIGLDKRLGKKF